MKGLLIDENMPERIPLASSLPLIHSTDLRPSAPDSAIWEYARAHELVIVSKDADFSDRAMLCSPPPWVVRFRIGNMRKSEFNAHAARVWPEIERLLPRHKLITVFRDRIEAIEA